MLMVIISDNNTFFLGLAYKIKFNITYIFKILCKPIIKDYHTSYYNIKFNNTKNYEF